MTFRSAIFGLALFCLAGSAFGQTNATPRDLPLPAINAIPRVPAPLKPEGNDPPARPDLSTAVQQPQPRSPFEFSGPILPPRPDAQIPTAQLPMAIGSRVTLAEGNRQIIRFAPRSGQLNNARSEPVGADKETTRVTYQGGLIVHIQYLTDRPGQAPLVRHVELAADNVVMWLKNVKSDFSLNETIRVEQPKTEKGEKPKEEKPKEEKRISAEMYLSGNVVIRTQSDGGINVPVDQVLRACEIFYEVDTSRAIAVQADLETRFSKDFDSIHVKGREIWQLGRHEMKAFDTITYSSKLINDPSLTFRSREATVKEDAVERTNIFGVPYRDLRTGATDVGIQRTLHAEDNTVRILGIPIGYSREYNADVNDPFGPLTGLAFRSDRINGRFQVYSSFDAYKLLGVRGASGNQWNLNLDYMDGRGPGIGTDFFYRDFFGPSYKNTGLISAYGLFDDRSTDLLGGYRGVEPQKPQYRGRFIWSHNQDIFESGSEYVRMQGQFAYQTDQNFYEQYYKLHFDQDPNQETFLYFYGAQQNFAWSALGQVNVNRPWVTETTWLPKVTAAVVGESWFDTLSYTARTSAGYALLRPASQGNESLLPQEAKPVDTLRADLNQRLSLPFDFGPFRFEPYGVASTTAYSRDLTGEAAGRVYSGLGIKAAIPFSKLYPDINSELFNVRGINHKIEFRANYFAGTTNVGPGQLPLLDRLNDDVSDKSYRDWRQTGGNFTAPSGALFVNTPAGIALKGSPIFDPTLLANRRLLDNNPDVLGNMQVLQAEVRQRWQTKRGPEGNDHTVDLMALDFSADLYPNRNRDNFGSSFGNFQYNWLWNVGDRVALSSSGWLEPFENGTKYFNLGAFYNRPDGSSFYLGYRHTDPIGSRVLYAVVAYQFSKKYSVSFANSFDLSNSFSQGVNVAFNRTGTDITMSLGLTYNSFQNSLGLQFLMIPNAALFGRKGQGIANLFLQ